MRELKWAAEQQSAAMPLAGSRPGPFSGARAAGMVAATSLILATLVVATPYFRPQTPEPLVTRLEPRHSTDDRCVFICAVARRTPDGRQLVFVANGEKASQLWVRPLDQVEGQPFAGTEGASFPFWAPDSRAIGFFAD